MEFKPTKTWLKQHKRSEGCKVKECHCLVDDWPGNYGFCVGIKADGKDEPDIVSFCCSYFSPEDRKPVQHQFLWHPQEANWIATALSLASVESWGMLEDYRKLVNNFKRKMRGQGRHQTGKNDA